MGSEKDYTSVLPLTEQPEYCISQFTFEWREGVYTLVVLPEPCSLLIETMSFKGTGFCGEVHRKAYARGTGQDEKS